MLVSEPLIYLQHYSPLHCLSCTCIYIFCLICSRAYLYIQTTELEMNYLHSNNKLQFKFLCLTGLTIVILFPADIVASPSGTSYFVTRLIVGFGELSIVLPLLLLVLRALGCGNYSVAHSLSGVYLYSLITFGPTGNLISH